MYATEKDYKRIYVKCDSMLVYKQVLFNTKATIYAQFGMFLVNFQFNSFLFQLLFLVLETERREMEGEERGILGAARGSKRAYEQQMYRLQNLSSIKGTCLCSSLSLS